MKYAALLYIPYRSQEKIKRLSSHPRRARTVAWDGKPLPCYIEGQNIDEIKEGLLRLAPVRLDDIQDALIAELGKKKGEYFYIEMAPIPDDIKAVNIYLHIRTSRKVERFWM